MLPALYEWLYQSYRKRTADFKANIRAFLKRFVVGQEVDNVDYMKSWKDDVFEFRVQFNHGGSGHASSGLYSPRYLCRNSLEIQIGLRRRGRPQMGRRNPTCC